MVSEFSASVRKSMSCGGDRDLARATVVSRTMFALRFREVAGVPPIVYLSQWRTLLAKRELRPAATRMRLLALKLGYASESSFSAAFKRNTGESPDSYRSRVLRDVQLESA